jgi:hypothetical protein
MKAVHLKDTQGRPCCVVQIKQDSTCETASIYMADLEREGYQLAFQHGGNTVWNFTYIKQEEQQ